MSMKLVFDKHHAKAILFLQTGLMLLVLLGPLFDPRSVHWSPIPESPIEILGLASTWAGIAFSSLGIKELGASFSICISPKIKSTLVTSGVYRLCRHPIYFGLLLMGLGWALTFASPRTGLLVGLLSLLLHYKASFEERQLRTKFGEAYVEYEKRVKRLIPFVL